MVTPTFDDTIIVADLIESGVAEMRRAGRWRLAALLTWALIGAGALGWAWSLWVVSP